jgi:HK97 family phage prohead protease
MAARSYILKPTFHLGSPSWKLDDGHGPSWRLDVERSTGLLEMPLADVPDLPAPGPMAAPPPPLEPLDGQPVARGLAMPWLTWTVIRERVPFLERFAPGSFTQTLRPENRDSQVVGLLNHGKDYSAGFKPLGKMVAWEASGGLMFELAFLDAPYARDVVVGARAGLYGASVRFSTEAERVTRRPARTQWNPHGLEERTITQARLVEISLTPVPAYSGTSAAIAA